MNVEEWAEKEHERLSKLKKDAGGYIEDEKESCKPHPHYCKRHGCFHFPTGLGEKLNAIVKKVEA